MFAAWRTNHSGVANASSATYRQVHQNGINMISSSPTKCCVHQSGQCGISKIPTLDELSSGVGGEHHARLTSPSFVPIGNLALGCGGVWGTQFVCSGFAFPGQYLQWGATSLLHSLAIGVWPAPC